MNLISFCAMTTVVLTDSLRSAGLLLVASWAAERLHGKHDVRQLIDALHSLTDGDQPSCMKYPMSASSATP
jgi:hypothetical protein